MRRLAACLALAWSALALTACDPQGGADAGEKASPAALAAPAPESFASARSAGGGLDLASASAPAAPARSSLTRTAALSASSAAPAPAEDAAARASTPFDNARPVFAASSLPARSGAPARVIKVDDRQFHIDTDGWIADPSERRRVVSRDRWHQNGTALAVAGRALDATRVPYISIPLDFKGARVGDLAQVCYGGRCAYAVVGDLGPRGRFGEGSVALARELGIDADGTSGGVESGVSYTLFPGSRVRRASEAELLSDIRRRGPQLAQAAGQSPIQLASL